MTDDMPKDGSQSQDERYLAIIRAALAVSRDYRPKFGKRKRDGYALAWIFA
jgi:hypothetical protein